MISGIFFEPESPAKTNDMDGSWKGKTAVVSRPKARLGLASSQTAMSDEHQVLAMILPPTVAARIREKYPLDESGCIPEEESRRIQTRLAADEAYQVQISKIAFVLIEYLKKRSADWGPWPDELDDCIAIGTVLAARFSEDLEEVLCEWPSAVLDQLEERCASKGISLEEWFTNRVIESKAVHRV
jgi:hypothetical protein